MQDSDPTNSESLPAIGNLAEIIRMAGFDRFGFTHPPLPDSDLAHIQEFIDRKFFASMEWYPLRQNIRTQFQDLGFPVASFLVLSLPYRPTPESKEAIHPETAQAISRYAWGEDYHAVIRSRAKPILQYLRGTHPGKKFRLGVDSLPLPEKILGRMAGLGWIGKNTLLIHPHVGSYFFLSVIASEVDLSPNIEAVEIPDRCGRCRACVDACPTQALVETYKLDANRCISHHTIEYRGEEFPDLPNYKTHGKVFGCDICQDVCPWNRLADKKSISTPPEFHPLPIFREKSPLQLRHLTKAEFDEAFQSSPILRTGHKAWLRNGRGFET